MQAWSAGSRRWSALLTAFVLTRRRAAPGESAAIMGARLRIDAAAGVVPAQPFQHLQQSGYLAMYPLAWICMRMTGLAREGSAGT